MKRAPLLTSPALGSSSYGAVRIPQDESDDNGDDESEIARRKDKPAHEWPPARLQRASFDSCAEEGPSSDRLQQRRRLSKSMQSNSSGRRRSSVLYTDGHRRRPSLATSDVGMGADSKYSFATGLAVPGNPVMQETPASSPYMTADDEDVLDIDDDDDTKPFDEDPPDNSPYVQFSIGTSPQLTLLLAI